MLPYQNCGDASGGFKKMVSSSQGSPNPVPPNNDPVPSGCNFKQPSIGEPELPRVCLTAMMPIQVSGTTFLINSGTCAARQLAIPNCLQDALDKAIPGDTITIDSSLTIVAPGEGFRLRKQVNNPDNKWILIQSSQVNLLPPRGTRVTPANAVNMPKLLSKDNRGAIEADPEAAFYYIIGIEVSMTNAAETQGFSNTGLVRFGDDQMLSLDKLPKDIVVDRCYIHGRPLANARRGISLNGIRNIVIDSYISEIHEVGADSQAVMGWSGPGPYLIQNNFLEAAGENIMFGGGDPGIPGVVPSDIVIRYNHFFKPLSWKENDPSYSGIDWTVKNLLETKNSSRVYVEGNLFENNWGYSAGGDQPGYAFNFKTANQYGSCTWCESSHWTIINNRIKNSAMGISLSAQDASTADAVNAHHFKFENNVWEDIGFSIPETNATASNGAFLRIWGVANVTMINNTVFQSGNIIVTGAGYKNSLSSNMNFTNNIFINNFDDGAPNYYKINGIFGFRLCDTCSDLRGVPALIQFFPNFKMTNNAIVTHISSPNTQSTFPSENFFSSSMSQVGFINFTGVSNGNYRLNNSSIYKDKSTTGGPLGADIDKLNDALKYSR